MDSTSFYAHILGLTPPWRVSNVDLDTSLGEVRIHVIHGSETSLPCPNCGSSCSIHDHAPTRTWRHLDTCQLKTMLVCSIPRVSCPEHGVQQVSVPWAEAKSRFTLLYEALAIDLMLCCARRRAAEILGTSEDCLAGIARRAVQRGLERKALSRMEDATPSIPHLSIDEKYWHRRQCATVVGDAKRGVVEEMVEGNTTASAKAALEGLGEEILDRVVSVSMDLHGPFEKATKDVLDETRIVFDPFHVVKLANEAMEQVRREEVAIHQRLDDPKGATFLKKARYSLLTAASRQKEWAQLKVAYIGEWFANTAEAYRLKETLRLYRQCSSEQEARNHLQQWIAMAKTSKLAPMRTLAKTVEGHLDGIVRVFSLGVTNAAAESLNARIQAVRVKCRGHRHFQAFRDSVLFHLGGLDLYPRNPHSTVPVSG